MAVYYNDSDPAACAWLRELIAAGLVLFLITLVVNMIARAIIARYKEFSGAN